MGERESKVTIRAVRVWQKVSDCSFSCPGANPGCDCGKARKLL